MSKFNIGNELEKITPYGPNRRTRRFSSSGETGAAGKLGKKNGYATDDEKQLSINVQLRVFRDSAESN